MKHQATTVAVALLGAVAGCHVCEVPEGTLGTFDHSGGGGSDAEGSACETAAAVVQLDTAGEQFDYLDLLVGPDADGRVLVNRVVAGAEGGTVTLLLDPALAGRSLSVAARAYRDFSIVEFATASFTVSAGEAASVVLVVDVCSSVNGAFCIDDVLLYCGEGETIAVTCKAGCDGGLCAPVPGPLPPGGECGAACGGCPEGCFCFGPSANC